MIYSCVAHFSWVYTLSLCHYTFDHLYAELILQRLHAFPLLYRCILLCPCEVKQSPRRTMVLSCTPKKYHKCIIPECMKYYIRCWMSHGLFLFAWQRPKCCCLHEKRSGSLCLMNDRFYLDHSRCHINVCRFTHHWVTTVEGQYDKALFMRI